MVLMKHRARCSLDRNIKTIARSEIASIDCDPCFAGASGRPKREHLSRSLWVFRPDGRTSRHAVRNHPRAHARGTGRGGERKKFPLNKRQRSGRECRKTIQKKSTLVILPLRYNLPGTLSSILLHLPLVDEIFFLKNFSTYI